ncbi:MAG: HD domain-containing protein [Mycoplasma sp.]|nr:HD domain-containing protein [Mycoplasma sp.]
MKSKIFDEKNRIFSYIDPIYKKINFSKDYWVWDLVFSKELIRLQNIFQLGLSFKVFPTATHTRFTHSIGTFKIAQDFANHFENQISNEERKLFLVAALLHDLGHGPFSHVFESISNIKHELLTSEIILDKTTDIHKKLLEINVDPNKLVAIYQGKYYKKWIGRMISSNLDVDRIDYLLRDSYYIGTRYSTIDVDFLIERSFLHGDDIYFSEKALNVIESFLLGRYYMHQDIYNNKKTYTFEWSLNNIFIRLREIKEKFNYYKDKIYYYEYYKYFVERNKRIPLNIYLLLNDANLSSFISSLKVLNDEIINSFLKYFFDYEGIETLTFTEENFKIIEKEISNSKYDAKYLITIFVNENKKIYYDGEKNSVNILDKSNKKIYKFPFNQFLFYKQKNGKQKNKTILINKILIS